MHYHAALFITVLSFFYMLPNISFATKYDDLKATASQFNEKYENIRKLTVEEQKQLVAVGKGFDEDGERDLLKTAGERVWTDVNDQFYKFNELKETFSKQLQLVLADETLKDQHDAAKNDQKRIDELWARIVKMMDDVKLGNNPIFKYFTQLGNEAHAFYQGKSGECHVKEFPLANGKADCVKRTPPSCEVIEVKAQNSKSISRGRTEAKEYAAELNKMGKDFDKLVSTDSGFKDCKEFKPRVACYAADLVVEDGSVKIGSLAWTFCD